MPSASRLIVTYGDRKRALAERTVTAATIAWERLPDYRDADIARWAARVMPVVAGAQQRMAALVDAYFAAITQARTGEVTRPVGIDPAKVTTEALRGVPMVDVYRRPGQAVWTALANGSPFDEAVRIGLARATAIVATDVQRSYTASVSIAATEQPRIIGYQRSSSGGCDLCSEDDGNTYDTDVSMPIHPGCNCDTVPVYDGDPAPTIDRDVTAVHDHGEIGPVLAEAGQHFTGPR